ncbi:MAG: peptide-methionine (R)-S-oxide reductase MsrB [Candidatus Micrarchaeota archaeon]|nr:peptide-methionine (R)-S-oxide reductase MsrB [Candidatus Micrarchaeota archaeon]
MAPNKKAPAHSAPKSPSSSKVVKSEAEWRNILTPAQYHILREKGTEMPFANKYDHHFEDGRYVCAACHEPLFKSETKFDSHCGWPAFWGALEKKVEQHADTSHGMVRTEVTCARCGSHLGHVFDDGPKIWGGKRFCINSESLEFVPGKGKGKK